MDELTYSQVEAAAERISGKVREVTVARADSDLAGSGRTEVYLALEFLQHTGTFKARGAQNFIQAHRDTGTLPDAGVTIASGGNAGMACAWAAREQGVPATVFLPATAPRVKVDRLRGYGADVRLVGTEYADALAACAEYAATTGALTSHAYDHRLIAAGAGTLMMELHAQLPDLDTMVVAVGGGGLFTGVATAAREYGVHTVAVEPKGLSCIERRPAGGPTRRRQRGLGGRRLAGRPPRLRAGLSGSPPRRRDLGDGARLRDRVSTPAVVGRLSPRRRTCRRSSLGWSARPSRLSPSTGGEGLRGALRSQHRPEQPPLKLKPDRFG